MLPPWQPPPRTPVLPGALLLAHTLALTVTACFDDRGLGSTSELAVTSSTGAGPGSSSGLDPTTSTTTGDATSSSTGALAPTTDTGEASSSTSSCIEVWYLDIDGDGYGGPETDEGCGPPPRGFTLDSLDCDDTSPKVYPGAPELCDGLDNDCDLGVDEWPAAMLGECDGCEARQYLGHLYYFCRDTPLTWQDARLRCQAMLADLVIVEQKHENSFLTEVIGQKLERWWLGLNDLAQENDFVWVDGSPLVPFPGLWANDEPNNTDSDVPGGEADCIALASELLAGRWRDKLCDTANPFVCETAEF